MKKLFILLLLLFSLASCDSKENNKEKHDDIGEPVIEAEKGTLENPYTIKEALDIIGTNTSYSKEKIYIKGIVEGSPYYNDKYSSYSVYLVDSTGGKSVQVYSATLDSGLNTQTISNGDTIVAGGFYTYYSKNNQPELAGDNNFIAYGRFNRTAASVVVINNNEFEITKEIDVSLIGIPKDAVLKEVVLTDGKGYTTELSNSRVKDGILTVTLSRLSGMIFRYDSHAPITSEEFWSDNFLNFG